MTQQAPGCHQSEGTLQDQDVVLQGQVLQRLLPLPQEQFHQEILPPDLQDPAPITRGQTDAGPSPQGKLCDEVADAREEIEGAEPTTVEIVDFASRGNLLLCLAANWALYVYEIRRLKARHMR